MEEMFEQAAGHVALALEAVAIVTGAGSGIGRAAAIMLSQEGYRLVLVGRRVGPLAETATMLGSDSVALAADIGDAAQCAAVAVSPPISASRRRRI